MIGNLHHLNMSLVFCSGMYGDDVDFYHDCDVKYTLGLKQKKYIHDYVHVYYTTAVINDILLYNMEIYHTLTMTVCFDIKVQNTVKP